ncbi:LysR family transcriptional regulator [Noviherbaspirillum sp. L7-7A]|uniref:LysR family transcriptional regulator n=1 Tax=Noviherbaspirillum sp. L7-7A TaxID=2850560 RepID=UPI001C2C71C2|nr:LysR family transcriptional regulator [Noviherbaspirillum sp. L7-7A]MBV0881532.1 LysR family transcriptional regulator [Noviherbaspirillum sp. L7-7A]
MPHVDFNHLQAFIVVARERSFTRAAAQLGVAQPSLSHTIKSLESRLGVRLLTRTTRGVSPTEAGERLLASLAPHYEGIAAGLAELDSNRDKPAGTIRITASDYGASSFLWPKLSELMTKYPNINIEIDINNRMVDILAERFDAGLRFGDQVAQDMIAVRITADLRMAVVATPSYFETHGRPERPQDLVAHNCINLRLATHGGLYAWEFKKDSGMLEVQVRGQFTGNTTPQMLEGALAGIGIAYVPVTLAQQHIESGRLVPVLEDWSPTFPGYYLYYPSRRQPSRAFELVVDALRHRSV